MSQLAGETLVEFRKALERLKYKVPEVVPLTPDHPEGEARAAWLKQADFWSKKLEEMKIGDKITWKMVAEFQFMRAFMAHFVQFDDEFVMPDLPKCDLVYPKL